MTAMATPLTGASSDFANWRAIDWPTVEKEAKRLQIRIAKAIREGRQGKAKALQWLLTHSFNVASVRIKRHIKIRSEATPYDPQYADYFKERGRKHFGVWSKRTGEKKNGEQ